MGQVSTYMIGSGLTLAAAGSSLAGVGSAPGLALVADGALVALAAAGTQFASGLVHGAGGVSRDNAYNAATAYVAGRVVGLGFSVRPISNPSAAQRLALTRAQSANTVAGGVYDFLTSIWPPGLAPQIHGCQ